MAMTTPSSDAERSKREEVEQAATDSLALHEMYSRDNGFVLAEKAVRLLREAGFTLCSPDECPMPKEAALPFTGKCSAEDWYDMRDAYQRARNEPKRMKP